MLKHSPDLRPNVTGNGTNGTYSFAAIVTDAGLITLQPVLGPSYALRRLWVCLVMSEEVGKSVGSRGK